jgi:hypothetical protein
LLSSDLRDVKNSWKLIFPRSYSIFFFQRNQNTYSAYKNIRKWYHILMNYITNANTPSPSNSNKFVKPSPLIISLGTWWLLQSLCFEGTPNTKFVMIWLMLHTRGGTSCRSKFEKGALNSRGNLVTAKLSNKEQVRCSDHHLREEKLEQIAKNLHRHIVFSVN